jgi:hypothetical protein
MEHLIASPSSAGVASRNGSGTAPPTRESLGAVTEWASGPFRNSRFARVLLKAELVTVGQSGEQSLKRIESAGGKASGGLKGLGRQAELLRTGIRTLGGALAGVATVGGLVALIDRSISAADAVGKTADKIGVGVEALQELRRFAAGACWSGPASKSGVRSLKLGADRRRR